MNRNNNTTAVDSSSTVSSTLLLNSIRRENIQGVRNAIRAGEDVNQLLHNRTPLLHIASGYGNVDIMRLLIESGADITSRDRHGLTPLHVAARNESLPAVRFLLQQGADVNAVDDKEQTPIFSANNPDQVDIDIVKLLVENGANINHQDYQQRTPLHYAVIKNRRNIYEPYIRNLLTLCADINIRDSSGRSSYDDADQSLRLIFDEINNPSNPSNPSFLARCATQLGRFFGRQSTRRIGGRHIKRTRSKKTRHVRHMRKH